MQSKSVFICKTDSRNANITVSTNIYSLDAIRAAAYKYTDDYNILISPNTDDSVTTIFENDRNLLLRMPFHA